MQTNKLGMFFSRTENVLYIDVCVLLAAYSCSGVWNFNRKGEVNNEIRNLCIVVMGYYPSSLERHVFLSPKFTAVNEFFSY